MRIKHRIVSLAPLALVTLLAGCASLYETNYQDRAISMMKRDFHTRGIAKVERLNQDALQEACNTYADNPPKAIADKISAEQLAQVRYPADGKYLGDWKSGEKLAQSGRGMTWSDKEGANGGNCYNCHQIAPQELSFGSIGPNLYLYGKIRGNTPEMQRYTYEKVYNSKTYSVCSNMPRFGHQGILTEQEIKDLVALLLDPDSPVNH